MAKIDRPGGRDRFGGRQPGGADGLLGSTGSAGPTGSGSRKALTAKPNDGFSRVLSDSVGPVSDVGLAEADTAELVNTAKEIGEELKRDPSIETLRRYREAVGRVVRHITLTGYGVEEHTSARSLRNRKRYTLPAIIDERLDQIARLFLDGQQAGISLLERVDEVNGMLVNLLL